MDASSSAPEAGTGRSQEASSSGQGSSVNLAAPTRGAWKGSDVKQLEIDWLYRSRRVPTQVSCRIPGNELEPAPQPGEAVVFTAHFKRGFGLPNFFRQFLDFHELQPHHLPGNAIFYLSCFVSFMEAYIGLLPTLEAFARFFYLQINSVQGKNIPKPKPPTRAPASSRGGALLQILRPPANASLALPRRHEALAASALGRGLPASEAGPSEDPPAKRSKKGDAGKKGTVKHYRSHMLVASG
ncbi:hypothetical protein QYE76_032674 [Lolium multiflorum]|uniref:Transposase (putative) gypsy type domain-containing protein n=1 Tax=Lolium multiflorum TaxID=4521 RepID=A0AAD8QU66_LOLMU|nr:hypothetical protein QYE76_032674 [Lolium multiflorum]